MPRRRPLTTLKQMSEISLTPLIDLSFLMLVTFIITFPLIENGIQVNLPKGAASELNPKKACAVTVDARGRIYFNDAAVSIEQLVVQLKNRLARDPDVTVMVRGDETVPYGEVVKVVRVLYQMKVAHMALVTKADKASP